MALAGLVAACCVLVSVTFRLYDTDAWEHLLVGKAIWTLHSVPTAEIWTWPNRGAPNVNPSWGFSALLWPFWSVGDTAGLTLWRWVTTLGAFALAWGTARRLGARGLSPFLSLVVCALVYRQRVQIRPETLAGVWLALTAFLLAPRELSRGRIAGLVAVACGWANTHVSYYMFFALLAFDLADAHLGRSRAAARRGLWLVAAAAGVAAFLNPFGVHALERPFQFVLAWRNEPLFRTIAELGPVVWSQNLSNGLPLLLAGWPALILWRSRRGHAEMREWLAAGTFTALALAGNRFVATYALAAAPWVARDLASWTASRRWTLPAPWPRAALVSAACVALCAWDWTHQVGPLGFGFDMSRAPVRACNWMEARGVRGRGVNSFAFGGYQLWRFWPDSTRLPLIDIHPEDATPALRALYTRALTTRAGWSELDQELRPDYALFTRRYSDRPTVLDVLDSDERWALVFVDDVAALYVRRGAALDSLASRWAYTTLGGARTSIPDRLQRAAQDPGFRRRMREELARQAEDSPVNFYGRSMLHALESMAP